jgi:hypothetical protein
VIKPSSSYCLQSFQASTAFMCINFFKKEGQNYFLGLDLACKASFFLLFELFNWSAISRVVVVLVKWWHHILDALGFLEDLPTLLVTETLILLSTGTIAGLEPLVRLIFSKFSKRLIVRYNGIHKHRVPIYSVYIL